MGTKRKEKEKMTRSKLARRSETFEILDEIMRAMSKDGSDWWARRLFSRFVRRNVRTAARHGNHHLTRTANRLHNAVAMTSAQIRQASQRLHAMFDVGMHLSNLGLSPAEAMAIIRNPSRTNADRAIITTSADRLANQLEADPTVGPVLQNLRTAENERRALNQATNPEAERIKSDFRGQTGTSAHAYMQCRSSRIFNTTVLNAIPHGNAQPRALGGETLRHAVYRCRLWIISRVLYFYGLRNTTSSHWSWS